MVKRRMNVKNFWGDLDFVKELRQIKFMKSANDNKDYSDADITVMILKDPLFQEIKKKLTDNGNFTAQIKIQMDRKRGKYL